MQAGTCIFLPFLIILFTVFPVIYCSNSSQTCVARQEFQCKIDGSCISMKKWQDGVDDCYDGSDEVCLPWQFDCQFGSPRCISKNKLNDKKIDCYSGFDEGCPAHYFVCRDRSACIEPTKYLNGIADCIDKSDEPCAQNQFQCADGTKCIPKAKFQDGKEDCDDGSDEECTTSQFACQCGRVRCVSDRFIMDGNWDCEDGSDEFINKSIAANCTRNNKVNIATNSLSLGKLKFCSGMNPCKPELGQVCVIIGGTWRCVCKLGTFRPLGSERCIPIELLTRYRNAPSSNCSSTLEEQFGLLQGFQESDLSKTQLERWSNIRRAPTRTLSGTTPGGSDGFLERGNEKIPFMFQEDKSYTNVIPDEIIDSYGAIMTPPEFHFSRDDIQCGNRTCGLHERCQRNREGKYECECKKGYVMFDGSCRELVDECLQRKHDCHPDARCVDALIGYECLCREGFLDTSVEPKTRPGRKCRKLVNECTNATLNDCSQNARCLDKPIGYTCRCQDDYVDVSSQGARKPGRNCTKAINECALGLHNCDKHAICQDQPLGFSCRCPFGYLDASPTAMEPGRKCISALSSSDSDALEASFVSKSNEKTEFPDESDKSTKTSQCSMDKSGETICKCLPGYKNIGSKTHLNCQMEESE